MRIEDWGLIEYPSSVDRQLKLVEEVAAGGEERLVICTHPPVVTLGRGTEAADLIGWSGETVETSRGGRATYHGPNQIVIYPVLDLKRERFSVRSRDIHSYLRALEGATVAFLKTLGLPDVEARETAVGGISLTGVWRGSRKIASIGIAVRKWVTYHGVAINLLDDPSAFQGIRPCGFNANIMTSVERELGQSVNRPACVRLAGEAFSRLFSAASSMELAGTFDQSR